ncbi:hypothetical protein ACFQH2_01800 [Natronoarchaeum sp. GCM10025703]|uniref:hypothetical protein n=1 Tax=unclassified Natronoarchaeum TaxID=2620183 RepID=UPI003620FF15
MYDRGRGSVPISDVTERLTLLALIWLAHQGETSAHAEDVCTACETQFGEASSGPSEEEVVQRLKRLAGSGFVEQTRVGERSPVGKGNPAYDLSVDIETALEPFEAERQIASLLESIEAS